MMGSGQPTIDRAVAPGNVSLKEGGFGSPFYARPLEYLRGNIIGIADGLRSLPDKQLRAELDLLIEVCTGGQNPTAEASMALIYQAEVDRRVDPGQKYDVDLELALQRLESMTNEADRTLVTDIGRKIYAGGGASVLEAARVRMIALAKPRKVIPRTKVLEKRWAGITS